MIACSCSSNGLTRRGVSSGDAVSSLPTEEFLRRADTGCADPDGSLPSPVIPHGYDRVAQWHMNAYGCKYSLILYSLAVRLSEP